MVERIETNPDDDKVSAEHVFEQFEHIVEDIEGNIRERTLDRYYNAIEAERLIHEMKERTHLLSWGLLPSDDYSVLSQTIDRWMGNAREITRNARELETCEKVVKLALDAVQGNMIANKLLSDEALQEIKGRWPAKEEI